MKSTIHKLPINEMKVGKCFVCGKKTNLRFRDLSGENRYGECCVMLALNAERMLAPFGSPQVKENGATR